MDLPGIEPGSPDCQPDVIPLYHKPVDPSRIELEFYRCERYVLPLNYEPETIMLKN